MNKKNLIGLSPNCKLIKEYKNSLTSLSVEQWEASIGLLLGDASLQTTLISNLLPNFKYYVKTLC